MSTGVRRNNTRQADTSRQFNRTLGRCKIINNVFLLFIYYSFTPVYHSRLDLFKTRRRLVRRVRNIFCIIHHWMCVSVRFVWRFFTSHKSSCRQIAQKMYIHFIFYEMMWNLKKLSSVHLFGQLWIDFAA